MERRRYLRWLGVAGAGAVSGCSALQSDDGATADGFTPQVADYLAVAIGNANTVALAVDEFQGDDPRESTFDEERPRDRLATAREALTEAESLAGESRQPDVVAARTYVDTVESTVDSVVNLLTASDSLEQAQTQFDDTEVDVETVREPITQASEASNAAIEARDRAVTASDEVDSDRLTGMDAEIDALRDGIDTLSGYVTGVGGLAGGYDTFLGGVEGLQRADDAIADDAFAEGRDAFASALEGFDGASGRFSRALAESPESLVQDLERGENRSVALGHFADGHVTLLDGRLELETAVEAADNGDFDAAREALRVGNEASVTAREQFTAGLEVPIDEFADQFETAELRAVAMRSLTDGYVTLLDANDFIQSAQSAIENNEYDSARASLSTAQETTGTASEQFRTGQQETGEFVTDEFDTAQTRAASIRTLASGYVTLLDANDHIQNAETAIENDEYDSARASLSAAQESAGAADEEFQTGQQQAGDFLGDEFESARSRADGVATLSSGYKTVLDARESIAAGESALFDNEYDDARDSFDQGAQQGSEATSTFERPDDNDGLFAEEFERARSRSQGITALGNGYASVTDGLEAIDQARDSFDDGEYDTAQDQLDTADEALSNADDTLESGSEAAGSEFTTEFERARCQTSHLQAATDHYKTAAEAAMDENRSEAESAQGDAEDELEQAEEC